MRFAPALLALLGLSAALVPWALNALDVSEARVHDGLWFAAVPLGLALLAALPRSGHRVHLILGGLALAAAAIELPGVWANATGGEQGDVAEHLRGLSRRHLVSYAVVAIAGIGLVALGLRRPRARS